jgi:hypothetical protein
MRHPVVLIIAAIVMMGDVSAFAQSNAPGRVYRGLFGGGTTGLRQSLTVRGNAGVGYSWRMLFGPTTVAGQPTPPAETNVNSIFEQVGGGINYGLQLSRATFSASVAASTTYYPKVNRPTYPVYRAMIGMAVPLWSGANFTLGSSLSRQSWYDLPWMETGGLAEQQVGPISDPILGLTGVLNTHLRSDVRAGIHQRITTRLSLTANYSYYRSHSANQIFDLNSQTAGGHASFMLIRGLSLRAGYIDSRHYFGPQSNGQYRIHNFDGGVDFNRAFSFTRGVTVTFSFGTSALVYGNDLRYVFTGHASLSRDLGRSWQTSLQYNRGVTLDEAFGSPFGSDRLNLNLGGLINRRLRFQSGIGANRSVSVFGVSRGYEQYYGRIGLLTAFSRYLGLGADYSYYAYRYDSNLGLSFFTNHRGDRHAIRLNLNVWAPLLAQRGRNATR